MKIPGRGLPLGGLLIVLSFLSACHPHVAISPRLHGSIQAIRPISLAPSTSVVGVEVRLFNQGRSDERIRRYFLRTPAGDLSEALTSGTFREQFQEHVRSWGRMGLPTVVPSGGTVRGWLFFEKASLPGTLVFRLLNTYGSAEALFLPVPARMDPVK
ncbi:MAG: hypothetical protein ACYCYP_01765 [Leptospirales bacterium]